MSEAGDRGAERAGSGGGIGSECSALHFGEIPQHLVQLLHSREHGGDVFGGDPSGDRLSRTEAVEHGAAAVAARMQCVVDGAGELRPRCAHGDPAGLSVAKSAEREKPKTVQHSA